ncbi:RNAse P, Rpr2/Rpp21 subunit [Spatholobus suberectus]|nr:RNAse P, Rpr2/Rpp21 subunit [Spatholobus suberectus]
MGKKGGAKKSESVSHAPISLREEATGKIQTKAATNTKSKLRFEHLKNLAVWATTNDPPIPSLGAFYGHQFAAFGEATGVPPDPSLITCQRCETVLQPGFNSTVRIEKNKSKVRHRHKKSGNITQNKVVYKCHFCLHQNLKRGTPKGHIKGICPSKDKSSLESTPPSKSITSGSSKLEKGIASKDEANEINVFPSRVVAKDVALIDGLATPSSTNTTTLLEGKKRRRDSSLSKNTIKTTNMSAKELAKSASTSSKRRRKSWTSLKEIAQSNEHKNSQVANLTIPFFL